MLINQQLIQKQILRLELCKKGWGGEKLLYTFAVKGWALLNANPLPCFELLTQVTFNQFGKQQEAAAMTVKKNCLEGIILLIPVLKYLTGWWAQAQLFTISSTVVDLTGQLNKANRLLSLQSFSMCQHLLCTQGQLHLRGRRETYR